jgi:hypothetical protein
MEFAYAGGGLGKGGTVSLFVDGKKVGEGKLGATAPMVFSLDDGCDVGVDNGSPVSPDYSSRGNEFNGRVKGALLAIAEDAASADHMISPEEAIRIAMARPATGSLPLRLPVTEQIDLEAGQSRSSDLSRSDAQMQAEGRFPQRIKLGEHINAAVTCNKLPFRSATSLAGRQFRISAVTTALR